MISRERWLFNFLEFSLFFFLVVDCRFEIRAWVTLVRLGW